MYVAQDRIVLFERQLGNRGRDFFLDLRPEIRVRRESHLQNVVQCGLVVNNCLLAFAGAQALQVVAVDGVDHLIQFSFQALAVRDTFRRGEQHIDGGIELAPRARNVALLVKLLARLKARFCFENPAVHF